MYGMVWKAMVKMSEYSVLWTAAKTKIVARIFIEKLENEYFASGCISFD